VKTAGTPGAGEGTEAGRTLELWPGQPYPLGATYDGMGVNFAIFSAVAEGVELCLFDDDDTESRVALPESTGFVWHGYVPGLSAGQRYGFRVHGPWAPRDGHRCLPSKLLLDPYARAIEGDVRWHAALFSYRFGDARARVNDDDSAPYAQRCVVVNPYFDWGGDRPPRRPLHETVIYETHVRGLTMLHPDVPPELRGTYAGLAHPAAIRHLTELGITAVELLPVHQFVHDSQLVERGLRNYWGYNSIGFFAPHNGYSSGGARGEQVIDFKQMVAALHEAGIEVILDVVYNHTAEGNHLGPTLSFRGIDNYAYYRLRPDDLRYYVDYTGTGNTLDAREPHVLQLIMDSLRYWVQEMHVDGFRFDLAATLARQEHAVERVSAFFNLIQQDPIVSQVKLIAEPWDVGEGGYQVGNFPPLWSEWNGKYRDSVRDYWRGEPETLGEMGYRLTGSSDLYESSARRPHGSINFVTAHDGFTLADLVAYNQKHNEANGEGDIPGESDNRSWNHGTEGPTDDPDILALRRRQQRNFLATLFLSQGVPMLLGGDEIGRTQGGNNNAYCQDNEISWYDWAQADPELLAFTRGLISFRAAHPVFRRRRWFQGRRIHGQATTDIAWFLPTGELMADEHWTEESSRAVGLLLAGDDLGMDQRGQRITDSSFYLLLNAAAETTSFRLPTARWGQSWRVVLDTYTGRPLEPSPSSTTGGSLARGAPGTETSISDDGLRGEDMVAAAGAELRLAGRSLVLLERVA
jgi:glycogen operon protein